MSDVVRLGVAGHLVLAIHRAQLLAGSDLRERLPDPGAAAAESHPERGAGGRASGDEGRRRAASLRDLASLKTGAMPGLIERYNGQHVVSLTANLNGLTLGEAAQRLTPALAGAGAPPRGVSVKMRGEIPALEQTISGLRVGLLLAVLVIFLLLAANFQSIRLALAIVLTIPAVLCGVLCLLKLSGTSLNVQSFMGAIMAIGIAVANSILLVTFAEAARREGRPVLDAAREGAAGRLRAILMTAAAMICGHGADGDRFGRRRRAGRAAGPRGDRRSAAFHLRDADGSALDLRRSASPGRAGIAFAQSRWIPRADIMNRANGQARATGRSLPAATSHGPGTLNASDEITGSIAADRSPENTLQTIWSRHVPRGVFIAFGGPPAHGHSLEDAVQVTDSPSAFSRVFIAFGGPPAHGHSPEDAVQATDSAKPPSRVLIAFGGPPAQGHSLTVAALMRIQSRDREGAVGAATLASHQRPAPSGFWRMPAPPGQHRGAGSQPSSQPAAPRLVSVLGGQAPWSAESPDTGWVAPTFLAGPGEHPKIGCPTASQPKSAHTSVHAAGTSPRATWPASWRRLSARLSACRAETRLGARRAGTAAG